MKKLLSTLILLFILGGCASKPSENALIIGTSSGYPPYEIIEPDGTLSGFDIEFGEALAKEMGYQEVIWQDGSFDGLIGKLQAGSIDLAIAGLSPDPAREAIFSKPYYTDGDNPLYVLTKQTSGIKTSEDIKGKVAGSQLGTIQESALKAIKDSYNLKIDARPDYGTIVQEILLDRIDFLMVEPAVAQEFMENYNELVSFEFVSDEIIPLNGVSVAMPINSDLEEKVNAAIDKLLENKTIEALIDKYFK